MAEARCMVRPLRPADQPAIVDIYNHYIENSPCTFDTQTFSVADRQPWFAQFERAPYACLVAVLGEDVVGYACCQRFKERPAYATSAEVSIYIDAHTAGRGIGTALYAELFDYLSEQPLHRVYAGITLPNDASVQLHHKFGFAQIGRYNEVGFKFNKYWDVAWFEKPLA